MRQSRTAAIREVQRAQIPWRCQAGETVSQIARVVHLACSKPKDLGYAAELWTRSALAKAGKATVQRILSRHARQPHKVRYYLERRDPDFGRKMREVLLVYQRDRRDQ